MNKRGQFYLVAAVIIIMVLIGVASVKTYAIIRSEPRQIQDIGSELNEEGSRIVDYGIYNPGELDNVLNTFNVEYAPYFLKKTEASNIVFIYGDKTDLKGVRYSEASTGGVSATIGGASTTWASVNINVERTTITDEGDNQISVTILEKNFDFDLKDNEMFYFVVAQERDDEIYIETNQ